MATGVNKGSLKTTQQVMENNGTASSCSFSSRHRSFVEDTAWRSTMQTGLILTLCVCGVLYGPGSQAQDYELASANSKIVGGGAATPGSWPWHVYLRVRIPPGGIYCGGTLISNEWVLTAAHCCRTAKLTAYTLYLGKQRLTGSNPNQVRRSVSQIILHPNFNDTYLNNDIALMKLSSPVNFTKYIRPVYLASANSIVTNRSRCWSTGWGRLSNNGPLPSKLQEVRSRVIENQQCAVPYQTMWNFTITDQMICAGVANKGTCPGDSGGPLQCKQDSRWIQGGITSFGRRCGSAIPKGYARVSEFQQWIIENVNGSNVEFVFFNSSGNALMTSPFKAMVVVTAVDVFLKLI